LVEATISVNLGSPNRRFEFLVVAPIGNDKQQPSFAIPLPGASAENQLLFRFSGQEESVSLAFALFDNGTDRSAGTAPSGDFPTGVVTLVQQIIYLRDFIYVSNFDKGFTLTLNSFYSSSITGVIENLSFDKQPGSTQLVTGSLTFKRGRVAGFA
jgi:hypothetical protein